MIKQNEQNIEATTVRMNENQGKKWHLGRSIEDKIGRQKYHEVLTKKVYAQNVQILDELRWIRHRLKALGEVDIDAFMLERYAIQNQVDLEILNNVITFGDAGVFPKDVAMADSLAKFQLKYYDFSRRIVRMNKRLRFEVGEVLFEKRGHKWAVSKFGFEVWGKSEKEVEEEKTEEKF